MPRIRIEWVPVQRFGLGLLGFDHLQLVFQGDDAERPESQGDWYVMEGVREEAGETTYLGIEGANGRMTLAVANLAAREALVAKIGTPEHRGSRELPYHGDEFRAWELMASYARDIDSEGFPYIAYGLPGSPTPTVNSSSAIASLIYYSGLDPTLRLPFGMHMSPGMTTLLGTSGDDAMRVERGFTTLLGGQGNDAFAGGIDTGQIEKFYGGGDDDLFHWSAGFNIVHGGQPLSGYAADGTDVMDYSGAGTVTITFNRHWIPHKVPNYVAVLENGLDHLFSIERIQWNETTDRIILAGGVDLVQDDVILAPGPQSRRGGDPHDKSGYLVAPDSDGAHVRCDSDCTLPEHAHLAELNANALTARGNDGANRLIGNDRDNLLLGLAGDDTLYGGSGNDILDGGGGGDGYVYLPGDGDDVVIDSGDTGIDELVLAGGVRTQDVAAFKLSQAPGDLMLCLAGGGSIRLKGFFDGASIERVVFDQDPAWTRDHLQALAASAAIIDQEESPAGDDGLVFRPELDARPGTAAYAEDIANVETIPTSTPSAIEPAWEATSDWLF